MKLIEIHHYFSTFVCNWLSGAFQSNRSGRGRFPITLSRVLQNERNNIFRWVDDDFLKSETPRILNILDAVLFSIKCGNKCILKKKQFPKTYDSLWIKKLNWLKLVEVRLVASLSVQINKIKSILKNAFKCQSVNQLICKKPTYYFPRII